MSRYRKVLTRVWEDDKFPYFSSDGRLLFLYHLTSPRSTPFLLYVEGPGAIGDALRMPSARLREAMTEVSAVNMVWYADEGSHLLFLPNALTIPENAPESGNAVKSWAALFRDLPKTRFRDRCLDHWRSLGVGIGHALTQAFVKACAMARPIQEQEQEQEQERKDVPVRGRHRESKKRDDPLPDEAFLAALKGNPAYAGIDVDRELGKLDAWLLTPRGRGKQKTRGRIVHWLNGADRPLQATAAAPAYLNLEPPR